MRHTLDILDILEELLGEMIIEGALRPSRRTDDIFNRIQEIREEVSTAPLDGEEEE